MSEHCEHCIDNCHGVLWQSENTRVAVVHHNGAGVSWWHDCPYCTERTLVVDIVKELSRKPDAYWDWEPILVFKELLERLT